MKLDSADALGRIVRQIEWSRPLQWLQQGWQDFTQTWKLGAIQGVMLAVIGIALLLFGHQHFWLLAGAFSGFMIIAPVLATSFYALSRALSLGKAADLSELRRVWLGWQTDAGQSRSHYWRMIVFGLLLALASTGWVLTSAALITVFSSAPVNAPADFLKHVVLANDGMLFELWMIIGGFLAAPMFASSVIAMPLLLDRRVGIREAVLISWYSVLQNPLPMVIWAMLVLSLTLIGFATLMIGLIVVVPWLGHASWHAYKDLVDADQLNANHSPMGHP